MYECPINIIMSDIETQFEQEVLKAVQQCAISVDKDELVKALNYDRQQYEKGYADAKAEQRWIPCSERLPEIGVNVLTVWTYEEFEPDMVVACLKEWNGKLYFDDVFGEYDHELEDVPAWMPLPEPWRGEEHDEMGG